MFDKRDPTFDRLPTAEILFMTSTLFMVNHPYV